MSENGQRESRQVRRADARRDHDVVLSIGKRMAREASQRERLDRQTLREKAGFYEGRGSVAASLLHGASRKSRNVIRKGKDFGRHLREGFHATKGKRGPQPKAA